MSFTNKPSQIFEASGYAYSVEYSQNGPFSNLSGITRRAYGGAAWENIEEIETFLATLSEVSYTISNHKVYRNGTEVVVSFVCGNYPPGDGPYIRRLHLFKSADGVTFPIHLDNEITHGQGNSYLTYYRDYDFYNIGDSIYHDRFNFTVKFDETLQNAEFVSGFFNVVGTAHSFGNLRYFVDAASGGSVEIHILDLSARTMDVKFFNRADFFTAPNNHFNAAASTIVQINGDLYLVLDNDNGLTSELNNHYIPMSSDGRDFDFDNAITFAPGAIVQYSAANEKYFYMKIVDADNISIFESDTMVGSDDPAWVEYVVPSTGSGLDYVLNSGGNIRQFRYHDAWNAYVIAAAYSSDFFFKFVPATLTLTDHSSGYGHLIMSNGTSFVRRKRYDFEEVSHSTDCVTWTPSDYAAGSYKYLDYIESIGWVAIPVGWAADGIWYSTNGINWFLTDFPTGEGAGGGNRVITAEPNKLRYNFSLEDFSVQQKLITCAEMNPTTHEFDVQAADVKNWYEFAGKPYLVRNNVTDVTQMMVLRDDMTGFIVSSDGDDDLNLDLSGINANYEVRGFAAFYDEGDLKLTAAYFDGTDFKLDILVNTGSAWEVDVTIDISDIYEFTTCEFDSDGGPITVSKAGGYYFVFGKLRNLTRESEGEDTQSMDHFDILLKGTTLDSLTPISIQTVDINSGMWSEIPYETRMELASGSSILANFSVKVDGSDVYVGMVENGANQKFYIAKTTTEFEAFTQVGPKVSPFVGGKDEDYFSVTEAGNFLAYGDGKLVLITSDGVRDYLTPNYIDHPEIPGYTFSIWQYYAYGANDRYCLTGTQVDPFSYEEVDYPAAVVLGLYDTEEETNQQFYIKFNELPLTFTGAECALLGSKFVNGAYHLIFNWWDDPSNSIGVEIFNVNLTTGALTSVAYELLSTNPSVDTVTGPTGQYKLENTNLNYFTIADRSVDNAGAYETFHIDDDMVVSLFRSFTFTGAANQWPGVPYVTSGGDMFLQVGDSDNGDLCTVYKVNGTTVELPTTPYTFPDVATKVISISPTRHLFVVIHGWDETTVAVLDENGNLVREVAEQDQYAGFVDPITEDTTKVRFGTGVSNASSTHYIKNIVQYLNDEDVPVYLVIAYQIFHYGEG